MPEDQPSTLIDGPIVLRDLYATRIPRGKGFGREGFVKKKCEAHDLAFSNDRRGFFQIRSEVSKESERRPSSGSDD
jgi:hypothetical protein